ncbi:MAG: FecR domain-containing protein [Comamonadaceae bacterium]|nr:FecR domain-containing protein [Comamonadaceae bacterium]
MRSLPPASSTLSAHAALTAFGQHYEGLVRFLQRRTGCADTARELAHETWLRLIAHTSEHPEKPADLTSTTPAPTCPAPSRAPPCDAARADGHDPARAYIYTVAARLALNRLRDQGRQQHLLDAACHTALHSAPQPGPAHVHSMRQALAAIEQHLGQLPPRQRQVLLAHRLDGVPQAELAQRHGVSVKTIERDIAAGMDALEAALYQWRGEAPQPQRGALHHKAHPAPSRRNAGRRRALSALLGLGTLGGFALAMLRWLPPRHHPPGALQWSLALDSGIGEIKRQLLPDGSHITLDAASALRLRYFDGARQAELTQGAALFAIAADARRPFTVHTRLAHITVVGTRFGVDWQGTPAAPQLRIAVQSGQVRVQAQPATGLPQPAPLLLGAGQQVTLDGQGRATQTPLLHSEDAATWQNGWLLFQNEPLGAAVERLLRYHRVPIRVAPEAAALPVLGRVRISHARQWLHLLPQTLPVRVRQSQDGSIDITARLH